MGPQRPGASMSDGRAQARALTGPEKAAALLFMMGRPAAIRILRTLAPEELRTVTGAATTLGSVTVAVGETLAEEFAAELAAGPDIHPSRDAAQALLADAFTPDQVARILSGPKSAETPDVWKALASLGDPALLALLDAQHPQVAAFIMTRLPPDRSAKLLGLMPMPGRGAVMRRMFGCGPVGAPANALLEDTLGNDITKRAAGAQMSDRPARMASILNQMERSQTDVLLDSLAQTRPTDAQALRNLLFDFTDIVKLPQPARALVFDGVATEKVVLALRGAEPALRDAVLSALGARARRMAEAELTQSDTTPSGEIARARRAIADRALALASRGQIALGGAAADAA